MDPELNQDDELPPGAIPDDELPEGAIPDDAAPPSSSELAGAIRGGVREAARSNADEQTRRAQLRPVGAPETQGFGTWLYQGDERATQGTRGIRGRGVPVAADRPADFEASQRFGGWFAGTDSPGATGRVGHAPVGGAESIVAGGVQGATLGNADELYGAFTTPSNDPAAYRAARDRARRRFEMARSDNPRAFGGSEMVTAALPLAATGGAAEAVGVPALLRGPVEGVVGGAIQGMGNSTEETAGGVAGDAARGAGQGLAFGTAAMAPELASAGVRAAASPAAARMVERAQLGEYGLNSTAGRAAIAERFPGGAQEFLAALREGGGGRGIRTRPQLGEQLEAMGTSAEGRLGELQAPVEAQAAAGTYRPRRNAQVAPPEYVEGPVNAPQPRPTAPREMEQLGLPMGRPAVWARERANQRALAGEFGPEAQQRALREQARRNGANRVDSAPQTPAARRRAAARQADPALRATEFDQAGADRDYANQVGDAIGLDPETSAAIDERFRARHGYTEDQGYLRSPPRPDRVAPGNVGVDSAIRALQDIRGRVTSGPTVTSPRAIDLILEGRPRIGQPGLASFRGHGMPISAARRAVEEMRGDPRLLEARRALEADIEAAVERGGRRPGNGAAWRSASRRSDAASVALGAHTTQQMPFIPTSVGGALISAGRMGGGSAIARGAERLHAAGRWGVAHGVPQGLGLAGRAMPAAGVMGPQAYRDAQDREAQASDLAAIQAAEQGEGEPPLPDEDENGR